MIVYLFGGLNATVPQPVPNIVQGVLLLGVHHAIGNTVAECMGRHVARLATSAVEKVWLDACLFGDLRDHVPDALSGDPVARPRR